MVESSVYLKKLIYQVLSAQPTSAEVERAFSTLKWYEGHKRHNLSSKNLSNMIMITKNLELFASKTDLINQTIGMLKKN